MNGLFFHHLWKLTSCPSQQPGPPTRWRVLARLCGVSHCFWLCHYGAAAAGDSRAGKCAHGGGGRSLCQTQGTPPPHGPGLWAARGQICSSCCWVHRHVGSQCLESFETRGPCSCRQDRWGTGGLLQPTVAGTWHHDSVLSGPSCAAAPLRSFLSVAPSLALQWAPFQVQVTTVEDRIWLDAAHMDPHGCQRWVSASCPFLGLLSFAVFPIRLLLLLRP